MLERGVMVDGTYEAMPTYRFVSDSGVSELTTHLIDNLRDELRSLLDL